MPQFTGNKFGFGFPNAGGAGAADPFAATGGTKITSGDYTYPVSYTHLTLPTKA